MPNRVIKESIKRSPQIDSLTWFEEVVFYRLIVTADDYGCIDGRPVLIKNELFPTRENVTRKSVEDAIVKLVAVGLLFQYEVDGRPYLVFPTWEKHQRIRNKHRKYPAPPDDIHLTANCCQMPASCTPESNPIQSESKSKSESKGKARARGEFGWVKLSDEEYNRLVADLGEAELKRCIAYIDESAQSSGNKNHWRDWNLVIRRCSRDGWGLKSGKQMQASTSVEPTPERIKQNADWLDDFLEKQESGT